MKNLKFSTRLIIGFSIIIFFSLIIAALAFIQIQIISTNVQEIYDHPLVVSNSVKEIEINVNAIHRSMKDVVLSENIEELNKYVEIVNNYDSLVQQSFKIVEERYLGSKNDVTDAHHTYNNWHIIRSEVIALKKAGKSNEAINITKEEGAAHVKLIHDKNKVIIDFAENKADEIYNDHLKEIRKSTLLLLAIAFILLMLSIIISVKIAKSISKPIQKFISDVVPIFKSEQTLVTEFKTKNEEEILLFTAKELTTAYHELEKVNAELTLNMEEKAKKEAELVISKFQNEEKAKQAAALVIANQELAFQNEEKEKRAEELSLANEERQKANEYLENLFRYANAPIIVWDTQFNITRFNPAFEALTGRKAIEVIGKSLEVLFPPDLRKEALEIIKDLEQGKRLETVEINIMHVNGTRKTVLWNSAPIMDASGNNIIATIAQGQDITERKQITENLNMTLDRLENSNKELEQFAYIASHDLQEPLRMISSYTQLLERKYKDKLDDDANEFIHYAVDGANRMQKMINDLLEYSRITSRGEELETIDTSIILGKAISMLQLKIEDNSALITNDDLPIVKGDASQILRVFQNLIENAIKYKKKSENPKIHISCQKKNNFYEFSVTDNGIGMDMKYKDKLFIIFGRLHSSKAYPGTGIGLAICKRIIERHGGKIWFESKEYEGSTFYFTIPALTLIKKVWKI